MMAHLFDRDSSVAAAVACRRSEANRRDAAVPAAVVLRHCRLCAAVGGGFVCEVSNGGSNGTLRAHSYDFVVQQKSHRAAPSLAGFLATELRGSPISIRRGMP